MATIPWCRQHITIQQPTADLAADYLRKAKEALETATTVTSRDWRITAAYYTLYFSLYSLLMQLGIKSEIHACTLKIAQLLPAITEHDLLQQAFQARIDAQYYTDRTITDETEQAIMHALHPFYTKCKNFAFTETQRTRIRTALS